MRHMNTTRRVKVSGHTAPIKLDAWYCPFCSYFVGCHRTLNNHVWGHLWMSMLCGVGDCFFIANDSKDMIRHAISAHRDVYRKSEKLTKSEKPSK